MKMTFKKAGEFIGRLGKKGKVIIGSALIALSSMALSVATFAEETGGSTTSEVTASGALEQGLTTVANDMKGSIVSILPICLGVVGAVLVITFGIKIFKKFTGK